MRTRSFLPPPSCQRCSERPLLGTTLINTGGNWLCVGCLTFDLPGEDLMTKQAGRAIEADANYAQSRRARVADRIEQAESFDTGHSGTMKSRMQCESMGTAWHRMLWL